MISDDRTRLENKQATKHDDAPSHLTHPLDFTWPSVNKSYATPQREIHDAFNLQS